MADVQAAGPRRSAAPVPLPGPHVYELTYEDTKITYVPVGTDGKPRLHYDGALGEYSFAGDEITTFRGARGLEVSVTLDRISHLRTITLTVFLPDLELEDATTELSFRTVGISQTRRRAQASDVGEGSSEPLELEGLARASGLPGAGPTVLL